MFRIRVTTKLGTNAFLAPDLFGSLKPEGAKTFESQQEAIDFLRQNRMHRAVADVAIESF